MIKIKKRSRAKYILPVRRSATRCGDVLFLIK
jgi:hypothetical protein